VRAGRFRLIAEGAAVVFELRLADDSTDAILAAGDNDEVRCTTERRRFLTLL
jgi:hypothetical protein